MNAMSKSVGCTTKCRFKLPKYFSWSGNTWLWFPVKSTKSCCRPPSKLSQAAWANPQVCVPEKCACAFGHASWSPLQTVHQSVTKKPALESVLEVAASFPGFRFHLSALRQGFRTIAAWNLRSNMLQNGVVCAWSTFLHMQGLGGSQTLFWCVEFFLCAR